MPTQARAIRKREALLDAAEREFATRGFDETTAKSIAADAKVAVGTFYQYFENKNDILREIARRGLELIRDHLPPFSLTESDTLSAQRLHQLFVRALEFVYAYHANKPELHQVLEQRRSVDAELGVIMREGEDALRNHIRLFVQTFNLPSPEIVTHNLFAMGEGIVHRQVFDQNTLPPEQVIEVGASMLTAYFNQLSNVIDQ
ncbi:TetR/AcrR family transcriptional regulator [Arenicella chitinivorans]|nr:TetR/AcrR family transcriptional regulator [Arenicella chitinivorans]